jgi:probable phosphoglycerate mutase
VRGWRLPAALAGHTWLTSPLARARQTAALLGAGEAPQEARLVEMSWGAWEGMRLDDLRAELGDLMRAWEAKGLDFCAPEGESPRQVQDRLRPFLAERAAQRTSALAVTHKGVIRALYALATGWEMTDKPAHKLRDDCVHLFRIAADGTPTVERLNVSLLDG